MSFVELTHPRTAPSPVLVEVPHSGLQVPPEVESEIDATPLAMLRDSDIYVDQLYQRAPENGATLLVSRVSRYVVDLNRGPDDVDSAAVPRHPKGRHIPARGVVWRARTDGTPLLRAPLTDRTVHAQARAFLRAVPSNSARGRSADPRAAWPSRHPRGAFDALCGPSNAGRGTGAPRRHRPRHARTIHRRWSYYRSHRFALSRSRPEREARRSRIAVAGRPRATEPPSEVSTPFRSSSTARSTSTRRRARSRPTTLRSYRPCSTSWSASSANW